MLDIEEEKDTKGIRGTEQRGGGGEKVALPH
jgi:hypothetical protein